MEILTQLFCSEVKVKLMRLFLFNPDTVFSVREITERSQADKKEISRELKVLLDAGIAKKRIVIRDIGSKKPKVGFILDPRFPYLESLKNLLIIVSLHADEALVRKFNSVGKVKFFVASGLFIQEWNTRVDLLIVGDDLNMDRLETVIKSIEAEVGKEIAYSAFETSDFEYRHGMHDRLIRDILDFPHTTLVDKLGLENK